MSLRPKQSNYWDFCSYDTKKTVTIKFQSEDQQTENLSDLQRSRDAALGQRARAPQSGEERPHLLRRPAHDALRVFVLVGGIHDRGVHFAVGSADQLCRLPYDLLFHSGT